MSGGKHLIDKEWFRIQREIHEEMDSYFVEPDCYECKKKLKIGDYVDGYHPYHQEYNKCKECTAGGKNDQFNRTLSSYLDS